MYTTNTPTTTVDSGSLAIFSGGMLLIWIVIAVIAIAAMWKIFTKAKQPGWAAIIPIYNIYILLTIVGRPAWWILLYLIPFVNIIVSVIVSVDLAKSYGKSATFGVVGLWIFSLIGYLMLAFGDAKYKGPSVAKA